MDDFGFGTDCPTDEDYLHDALLELGYISESFASDIGKLRRNDPDFRDLTLKIDRRTGTPISFEAWKLLGRYVGRNDHVETIDFSEIFANEADLVDFFSEMSIGRSVDYLDLSYNKFSVAVCNRMIPFLTNSKNLKSINIEKGNGFNTTCFNTVVRALSGGPIESLAFEQCNIDDISVLEDCDLQHITQLSVAKNNIVSSMSGLEKLLTLETLNLWDNPIDAKGCEVISKLFRDSTKLIEVYSGGTNIDDEGAGILAGSLRQNKTLYYIELESECMTEKGQISFLHLLCDISSIENTYTSNHTLGPHQSFFERNTGVDKYLKLLNDMNGSSSASPHAIGRSKVLAFHLNSERRKELCRLQGIDYCFSSIFSEFDPLVLPDVLALVGREHGQTELYRMLSASASILECIVDKESVIKNEMDEIDSKIASLQARKMHLGQQLAAIQTRRKDQSSLSKGKRDLDA